MAYELANETLANETLSLATVHEPIGRLPVGLSSWTIRVRRFLFGLRATHGETMLAAEMYVGLWLSVARLFQKAHTLRGEAGRNND